MTDPSTAGAAMPATSFEVRAELEDRLERDLLGPWDGPEEELPPHDSPAERYLLGRLVPRDAPVDASTADAEGTGDDPALVDREVAATTDTADTDVESEATVRAGTMAASAIGVSFFVPEDVDAVLVAAEWGRYERVPSEVHKTEQGRPRTVWKRRPAGGSVTVPLDSQDSDGLVPDPRQEGVVVRYTVRHRDRRRVVELALVNGQRPVTSLPDTVRLYQAKLAVTATDGESAIFIGHNDPELGNPPSAHDDELLHLALLHRARREYAHGRQCAVDVEVREGEMRAWRLTTTCFPAAEVPLVEPGSVPGVVLDMARLGSPELARDELDRALRPLTVGYRVWLMIKRADWQPTRRWRGMRRRGSRPWPPRGRWLTGWTGRSTCCVMMGSRGRRSGLLTRRWRCSGSAARWSAPVSPTQPRMSPGCCAGSTGPSSGPGGRFSSHSCCCAFRGSLILTTRTRGGARRTPRCSCCSSRPVAGRPRRTWG